MSIKYFTILLILLGLPLSVLGANMHSLEKKAAREGDHNFIKALQPQVDTRFYSPDHKFIAKINFESGVCEQMRIYRVRHSGNPVAVSPNIIDINGFMWLPRYDHRMLYATCCECGEGSLAIYVIGQGVENLKHAKNPDYDCFQLYGYYKKSRHVIYGYAENFVPQYNMNDYHKAVSDLKIRRSLTLR